jgi:hypothetical protein
MFVVVDFSRIFLLRNLIFKGLTARRLYKSFGVKRLKHGSTVVGLGFGIQLVGWISFSCESFLLPEISAICWSFIQSSPTKCGIWVWSCSFDNEKALVQWELLHHRKLFLCVFQTASCQRRIFSQQIRSKRFSFFFWGFCMYILSLTSAIKEC